MAAAPKKQGSGCGCALAVLAGIVILPLFGLWLAGAVLGIAGDVTGASGTAGAEGGGDDGSGNGGAYIPLARADPDAFSVGWCSPTATERTRTLYTRNTGGAARWLRGKVVIVHLRIEAPGVHWSDDERRRGHLAADAVTKLYRREAARYGIHDLEIRTVPWPLQSTVSIPSLTPGERDILPLATSNALEAAVRKGLASAEARTLDGIAEGYRKQGYSSVAFIAYVPTMTTARSFASPHGARDASAELAFVFETKTLLGMSTVAAHEGLHLFGADDLYQMNPPDDADAHDLMSACRGFRGNGIEEMTAWAVGWRQRPPARRYRN